LKIRKVNSRSNLKLSLNLVCICDKRLYCHSKTDFNGFEKLNKKIAKLYVSIAVGLTTMLLVYIALQISLKEPSLSRLPMMSDTAVSIVMKNKDGTAESHNFNNFMTRFVYVKGNGSIFESDPNSNSVGKYLGSAGESTITTGNHFAWEVLDKKDVSLYYVDSITGDIIMQKNLSRLPS
jgi:hypothetical protein